MMECYPEKLKELEEDSDEHPSPPKLHRDQQYVSIYPNEAKRESEPQEEEVTESEHSSSSEEESDDEIVLANPPKGGKTRKIETGPKGLTAGSKSSQIDTGPKGLTAGEMLIKHFK
jgi:hypothetical protein